MRRMGIVFALAIACTVIGAATVVSWIANGFAWHAARPVRPGAPAFFWLFPLAFVVFVVVLRRVGAPIGDVITAAHRIADGDFAARVPPYGPRSVRAVARAFNDMAQRLEAQEQQRRALMAEIAHELRTPLSVIQGRIEGMLDGVYAHDAAQLEPLLDETRVLTRLVEDLRTLAIAESGTLTIEREPTDVGMLARDAVAAVANEAAARGVAIEVQEAGPATAAVDPVRLRQVLVNLLTNAVRHGREHGHAIVRVSRDDAALHVDVSDDGPGLTADEAAHVFDRFYRGKGSRGSGLGLTIARTLVRAHGGDISVASGSDGGTTFAVTIPTLG